MDLEPIKITGRIIQDLGVQSGTSKAGRLWKKKEYVLETFGTYPRKVKFHIFGDRADTINLEAGKDYTLFVDVESREFNGRWYTDVNVYSAQDFVGQNPAAGYGAPLPPSGSEANSGFGGGYPSGVPFGSQESENDEDLPF